MPDAPALVTYRVHGGPVNVDQRLTVFDDGEVELDEHHRGRDAIRLAIGSSEVGRIRELLGSLTSRRSGLGDWVRRRLSPSSGPRFRLQWAGGKITDADPDDPALAELLSVLDELRIRAVRSQPR